MKPETTLAELEAVLLTFGPHASVRIDRVMNGRWGAQVVCSKAASPWCYSMSLPSAIGLAVLAAERSKGKL